MENKKLVNILLKDMGELEEMVAEMKNRGHFNTFEIEFLHTRAKGILQLLQMLNGSSEETTGEKITTISETNLLTEEFQKKEPEVEQVQNASDDDSQDQEKELMPRENASKEEEPDYETERNEDKEEVHPEIKAETNSTTIIEEETIIQVENREVELEDEEIEESRQRIGDSFLKGKSVNDLITDQNKLEFKLSNRPVSSIQSAIGINDRFQYIRELFTGSPEIFSETVTSLDSMDNINDAVDYLRKNFKWKKNETSLKFVNLVKRRFADE